MFEHKNKKIELISVFLKPATKEMTLKDIEKELGYKVRIKED